MRSNQPSGISWSRFLGAMVTLAMLYAGQTTTASANEFPYVAYVVETGTRVLSGPGAEHYATGELPAGFAVEVYRHDGDGWCAVRPPEGEFSLVEARQVRILDSRTAEVTGSEAMARVGSKRGDDRSAVQVVLKAGETVQLAEPPKPGQPFVKIAPPAGEFRWIEARRLSRTPPVEGSGPMNAGSSWQSLPNSDSTPAQTRRDPSGNDFEHLQPVSDEVIVVEGSPAEVQLAQYTEAINVDGTVEGAASSSQPRIRFPGRNAKRSTGPLDPRVEEMQLRLSAAVVQPPVSWQLSGLRNEAAALLAQQESAEVREQLRDVLDRVVMFESIKQRHLSAAAGSSAAPATSLSAGSTAAAAPAGEAQAASAGMTGQSGDVLARIRTDLGVDDGITPTPEGSALTTATTPAATEALYDAVGTLKPVVSRRSQAPRFALVDDHGDVVTFVTSSPELNLQPYVGKRIGVRGTRGFMPEYRRAHVTASRVTPLEEKLVR